VSHEPRVSHSPLHRGYQQFSPLVALLIALAVLAGCAASSATGAQAPATPSATVTPTLPPTTEGRLTQRARQAVGAAAQRVDVAYHAAGGDAVVTVTLVWSPRWKDDFAQAQAAAKLACYQTHAALWTSGEPLGKVTVIVLGQALDDYASVITSAYAEADLTAQHARSIDWSSITADQAWARYDHEFLRPTYTPDWIYPPPSS
jgi:hypothetical protein